ncbi:blue light- and temperature-responsive anti-repressor [Gammaproteobacteria bacterium]
MNIAGVPASPTPASKASMTTLTCSPTIEPESSIYVSWGGRGNPPDWKIWGHPLVDDGTLWCLRPEASGSLAALLDQLGETLSPFEQQRTLAAICSREGNDLNGQGLPLNVLRGLQPLSVLLTRQRHPWLMGELAPHLQIHFQPIVDLNRGGQVFAYEALCRGFPQGEKMLSGHETFVLAAGANRQEALDLTCQQLALAAKKDRLPPGAILFLNVMPNHLMGLDLAASHWAGLAALGIRPEEVVIEIVESEEVKDLKALAEVSETLRTMGLRIALDDLGSGYNGLSTLALLRPDYIKLDRNLVHGVQSSRVRLVLLEALIGMAQRLGCDIIAEGLERAEDVAVCQEMGVRYAQGYYFAPPAPDLTAPRPLPPRTVDPLQAAHELVQLQDFLEPAPGLALEASVPEAREFFRNHPDQAAAIVVDDGKPVGYLTRRTLVGARDQAGLGRHCLPLHKRLREQMNPQILARRLYREQRDCLQPWVVVDHDGNYLGMIEPWDILAQLFANGRHEGVHPLSQLPTGPVLRNTLDMRLRSDLTTTLVYIDLDHFKAFNDR